MNRIFCYQKKATPSFEKMVERLEKIEMPDIDRKIEHIVDEIPTGYKDPRWIDRSNSIKARDNYTCQLCHAFNPMQEELVFIQQGEYETYHQYKASSRSYMIHVKGYDITINFDFYPGFHLAMPRLNVHHKIYYRNRNLWDYNDDCLVTLCENCHQYVHSLNDIRIPIVEETSTGETILVGITKPKSYQTIIDHTDLATFNSFAIVKENRWGIGLKGQNAVSYEQGKNENKKWYDYQDILDNHIVHIGYFKCFDSRWNKHTPEEIKIVADFIIQDFIENTLGYSNR